MDREILFRGKRTDNGEWVEGYYTKQCDCYGAAHMILHCAQDPDDDNRAYYINPETVGQYTGLTDKNGKKIFEGDILECNGNSKDLVKVVFGEFDVVEADTLRAIDTVIGWHYEVIPTDALSKCEPFSISMPLADFYIVSYDMQIIGNIYDNPELLEKSE